MGPPKFYGAPLHACHALKTPADLQNLTITIPLRGLPATLNSRRLHLTPFRGCTRPGGVRSPLRPAWFPVYASSLSFGSSTSTPLLRTCNTRYGWVVSPYPAGTRTLQEAPSLAWRTTPGRSAARSRAAQRPGRTGRRPGRMPVSCNALGSTLAMEPTADEAAPRRDASRPGGISTGQIYFSTQFSLQATPGQLLFEPPQP
jgi:hypothetical protein